MYWLDTVIILIFLIGAGLGALTGFVWQLSRLLGLVAAIFTTIYLNGWASNLLRETCFQGTDPMVSRVVAYGVVFIAVFLVFFTAGRLLERGLRKARLQPIDRWLGAGVGLVKTGLILGAVFLGMVNYPHPRTNELISHSRFVSPLINYTNLAIASIPAEYRDELQKGLEKLREAAQAQANELHPTSNAVR
jgi:membrane protein required for colicin V production